MTTLPKSIHFIYCQSVTRGKLRPSEGQKIQKANPPIDNLLVYMGLNEIMVASLFSSISNRLLFNNLYLPASPIPWILASASMTLREACNVRPAHPSLKSDHCHAGLDPTSRDSPREAICGFSGDFGRRRKCEEPGREEKPKRGA